MFNKFSCFIFFALLLLSTVFIYNQGHTHQDYPNDFQLGGSTYADVEGNVTVRSVGGGTDVHIHGIVYSSDHDDDHKNGNYTLTLEVSCPENVWDDDWWEAAFDQQTPVSDTDNFTDGVRWERDITFHAQGLSDVRGIEYRASATVENGVGIERDFIKKPINSFDEVAESDHSSDPNPGIYLADSDQTIQTGDNVTLNLITAEPFYDVSWYVHTPGDTSSSGTYLQSNSGDGTSTDTSLSYTFPSGTMHTGSYLFRAVIYQWSDMTWYGEETYTVIVE